VRAKQATAILDASDEDMLREFEELGRQGYFREEPDFPVALENYRQALATSPKSCPASASSPEANQAFFWMYELLDRVRRAISAGHRGGIWRTASMVHRPRCTALSALHAKSNAGPGRRPSNRSGQRSLRSSQGPASHWRRRSGPDCPPPKGSLRLGSPHEKPANFAGNITGRLGGEIRNDARPPTLGHVASRRPAWQNTSPTTRGRDVRPRGRNGLGSGAGQYGGRTRPPPGSAATPHRHFESGPWGRFLWRRNPED